MSTFFSSNWCESMTNWFVNHMIDLHHVFANLIGVQHWLPKSDLDQTQDNRLTFTVVRSTILQFQASFQAIATGFARVPGSHFSLGCCIGALTSSQAVEQLLWSCIGFEQRTLTLVFSLRDTAHRTLLFVLFHRKECSFVFDLSTREFCVFWSHNPLPTWAVHQHFFFATH